MAAQHVNPEEAVKVMLDLRAKRAMGIHWGTFKLTDESRDEPPAQLELALARHRIELDRFIAAAPGYILNCHAGSVPRAYG